MFLNAKTLRIPAVLLILSSFISPSFGQDSTSIPPLQPNWGIGLKSNNGITVKKYFKDKGLELIVRRSSPWRHNYYYSAHDSKLKNKGYTKLGNEDYSRPYAVQIHYLTHKDVRGIRGLKWYYGMGGQFMTYSYSYDYAYDDGSTTVYGREKVNGFSLGWDGVAGLEYTFKYYPLSLFYDINVYVEGFKHPLYMKLQSGIGLRYNF